MPDFMYDPAFQIVFDETYRASLPPQVAALLDEPDPVHRLAAAQTLAAQGYVIDVPIQVWNWNPYMTMAYRSIDGFTWVPSALQPSVSLLTPLSNNPPYDPYDPTSPPVGSIKVSLALADYPAFKPAPPPPPSPSIAMVGSLAFGNTYKAGAGTIILGNSVNVFDGEEISQDGAVYTAHVSHGPFGIVAFYSKRLPV